MLDFATMEKLKFTKSNFRNETGSHMSDIIFLSQFKKLSYLIHRNNLNMCWTRSFAVCLWLLIFIALKVCICNSTSSKLSNNEMVLEKRARVYASTIKK